MEDTIKGHFQEGRIVKDLWNLKHLGHVDLAGHDMAFNQIIVFALLNLGWGDTNTLVCTSCNSFQLDFSRWLLKYFLIQIRRLNKAYFINNCRKTNG